MITPVVKAAVQSRIASVMKILTLCLFFTALSLAAVAQETDSPSIGVFAGAGIQNNGGNTAALHVGGSIDQTFPNGWVGYMLEGGFVGPFDNLHGGAGLLSFDYMPSWLIGKPHRPSTFPLLCPFATVGYTQLFGTGNAVNYGAGIDWRLNGKFALRLEGRDYMGFTPHEHIAAFRIGFRRYFWD